MYLDKLDEPRLRRLYEQEMKRDFPPTELKPLRTMCALMAQGRYDVIGLYEDGTLLGYALLWLEPGVPFALLDYLGTLPGVRNRGLGGQFLDLLAEHYRAYRGIYGEAEAPENGDPAGEALRRRRLGFYLRHGFRYGGYDCALFGVHYQVLIRGAGDVTAEELLRVHQGIYRRHLPPAVYERFIQIPLPSGQAPRPVGDWVEGETTP